MNIQEAAELIKKGLLVRRVEWAPDKYLGIDEYGLYVRAVGGNNILQMHFSLSLPDLAAEDWEIYIPQRARRLSLRAPIDSKQERKR